MFFYENLDTANAQGLRGLAALSIARHELGARSLMEFSIFAVTEYERGL